MRPNIKCQVLVEDNKRCQRSGHYPFIFVNSQGNRIIVYICDEHYEEMKDYAYVL